MKIIKKGNTKPLKLINLEGFVKKKKRTEIHKMCFLDFFHHHL